MRATTRFLARPRRVGFAGMGDASTFDFSIDPSTIPTTDSGGIDWSQFTVPSLSDSFTLPPASTPAGGPSFDFAKLASDVVKGAQTYYGAQAAVSNANYAAQLAKARAQAAVNVAKAQGQNATATARAGLPSPTLLLAAGVGLVALMLLRNN